MPKRLPALALFAVLAACSSRPDDALIKTQLVEALTRDAAGLFTVENVVRTNGFEASSNVYQADVEYDLVFQKSLTEVAAGVRDAHNPLAAGLGTVLLGARYGDFRAGQRLHQQEKLTFHKTERGWQLQPRE